MTLRRPVVVTGSGGFIGARLISQLRERGFDPVGWTRTTGDLCDANDVQREMAKLMPSTVFHLAAGPGTTTDSDARLAADAVAMIDNLVESLPTDARLICTGSMAEYGYGGTFNESATRRPTSSYGIAKAAASDHALALQSHQDIDVRVARLFGVYGPGERSDRLIPHVVRNLVRKDSVPLSDGTQIRDFVHVDDVCDCLIAFAMIDEPRARVLNIGTGVGVTVRHVCESACAMLDADPTLLRFGEVARRVVDEDELVADATVLAQIGAVPKQHWLQPDGGPAYDFVLGLADGFASS